MIIVGHEKPSLDDLMQVGVKGMKWGVRKDPQARRLARVERKIDKIDADKVIEGYELRGWAVNKVNAKKLKKDPTYKYSKLSKEEKRKVQERAEKKITRSLVMRGTAETALIIGGGNVLMSVAKTDPRVRAQGNASFAALAVTQVGVVRVNQVRAVKEAGKLDRLQAERDSLRPPPPPAPPRKKAKKRR